MPTLKVSLNGFSAGCAGSGGAREKARSRNSGWTPGASRRNREFLQSVDTEQLDGDGYAFTLTVRDVPGSAEDYARAVDLLTRRLRHAGCLRWHRVLELTKRRRPHLHGTVYFPPGWLPPECPISDSVTVSEVVRDALIGSWLVGQWREVAGEWGTGLRGQDVKAVDGALGWLQYTAKHADRGPRNYQRLGSPPGWVSMPKVWSRGGEWPTVDPLSLRLDREQFVTLRRFAKRYVMAQRRSDLRRAESYGDVQEVARARRSLGYLNGSLRCNDRGLSAVRGIAHWCPQDVVMALAVAAGWDGELVTA